MNSKRILIAGIGNIFFGDDAFGVEVARRMAPLMLPEGVRVVDFGVRGLDLTYALLDPWEAVILVDALPRGGPVGTVYALEIEVDRSGTLDTAFEPHAMDPMKVLRLARDMGSTIDRVYLVGCDPGPLNAEDMQMEISEPVRTAVEEAIALVESLVSRILADRPEKQENTCGQPLERRRDGQEVR
jgi:hydrogenase maturation protease